MGWLKYNSLMM